MTVTIITDDNESEFEAKNRDFEDTVQLLEEQGVEYEIRENGESSQEQATNEPEAENVEVVPEESETDSEAVETATEVVEPTPVDQAQLSQNPIDFLKKINESFVNTIKGKPAISKQGFRYIQREFGITTEAEVVQWIDDPTGVIVWAKAELPDGHSAEAHGEGYLSERKVDDNEFVRYADTRSKNRAISDLTASGALAVSELVEDEE